MTAPRPAPPPMRVPVRLPFPLTTWRNSLEETEVRLMLESWMPRVPSPLNRPWPLEETTVPVTGLPARKTVTPLAVTGATSVPEKESPTELVLELRVWPMRTVTRAPAGTE